MSKLRDSVINLAKVVYTENQIVEAIIKAHNDALESAAKIADLQQCDLGNRLARKFRNMKEFIL